MKIYITNNYYNEPANQQQSGRTVSVDWTYIKSKPEIIVRFISVIFAIVVFSCLAAINGGCCVFNCDSNACNYGIAIGVIAFLLALTYIFLDAFSTACGPANRKAYMLSDLGFSTILTLLWFIGFCYMTNRWTFTHFSIYNWAISNANAALSFSFFSIITWSILIYFATKRYREGQLNNFMVTDVDGSYPPIQTSAEAPSSAPPSRFQSSSNRPEATNQTTTAPYASTEGSKPNFGGSGRDGAYPYQGGGFTPYQSGGYPPYQGAYSAHQGAYPAYTPLQNTETSGAFGNSSSSRPESKQ